jgi:hypothetical protein
MKIHSKERFKFRTVTGFRNGEENEVYYNEEWRFVSRFPFVRKFMVEYEMRNDLWTETNKIMMVK